MYDASKAKNDGGLATPDVAGIPMSRVLLNNACYILILCSSQILIYVGRPECQGIPARIHCSCFKSMSEPQIVLDNSD
jgi:hypothetical protein